MRGKELSVRSSPSGLPKRIRVSVGTAVVLGLLKGKLEAVPTTAYLLTFRKEKCVANCGFCPQAKSSHARADMLSRVSWPAFPTKNVLNRIEKSLEHNKVNRICLQALNYPEVFKHLLMLVKAIYSRAKIPISISCQPMNLENIVELAEAGAERIGIPLDAATEGLFDKIKGHSAGGPYTWERRFDLLSRSVDIFGRGKTSTHLIVGLGETEKEMIETIQRCVNMGVLPALFAFTPVPGTTLECNSSPPVSVYRRIQVSRYLIVQGHARYEDMNFDKNDCISAFGVDKEVLTRVIQTGEPFRTSGCPECNRPFYNEKPSGPIYNYPRALTSEEVAQAKRELKMT